MTAITERNLSREGYQVETILKHYRGTSDKNENYCEDEGWVTDPAICFWRYTFNNYDFSSYSEGDCITVVDIPIPEPDSRYSKYNSEDTINLIRTLCERGIRVILVDHHKMAFTYYGAAIRAGAEVLLSPSAQTSHYGLPDSYSLRWGKVGAISDCDTSVLPVSEEEEQIAGYLDGAVREDALAAFYAIKSDNISLLKRIPFPSPDKYEAKTNLVFIPELAKEWGYKQLSELCKKNKKPYGVGIQDKKVIIAITYWKLDSLPVAFRLGLTRFRGHGEAVNIDYSEEKLKTVLSILDAEPIEYLPNSILNTLQPEDFYQFVSSFMHHVKIPYFLTMHGWKHIEHVISLGRAFGSIFELSADEQQILDWACLLHDVGNGATTVFGISDEKARECHHVYSYQMIRAWADSGLFRGIIEEEVVKKVADLCFRHRRLMPLPGDERLALICLILRLSDSLDADERRAKTNDNNELYEDIKKRITEAKPESIPHWEGNRAIKTIRLHIYKGEIAIECLVTDEDKARFLVCELIDEVNKLHSNYHIKILPYLIPSEVKREE